MNTQRCITKANFGPLVLCVAICLAAAPAASPSTTVVALAAADVPDTLEQPAAARARIESAVSDSLRERGFEVLPSSEYESAWQSRVLAAGGYFDIVSGRPDLAKRRALRASVLGELQERYDVRALLQPALVVVVADYWRGEAAWDGAKETAAPSGSGELPALSLALRVEDLGGREIASARAGIQLLAKYSMWNGKHGTVPREKLLADESQLREAAGRAVSEVLDALRAAPAAVEIVESIVDAGAVEIPAPEIEPAPEGARVLALSALLLPGEEIVVPDDVQSRYMEELRTRLEEAGFWVLPPEVFERALRGIVLARGGLYDPVTGEGDAGDLAAAVDEARRRVAEQHGASLFVTAGIFVRPVRFSGETASWDGVSEQVVDIASWKKPLVTTRGTTQALSLGLVIEGVDGTTTHIGWGGIQLLQRLGRLDREGFVHVAPGELFQDPARDRRAVALCLAGWPTE